MGERVRVRGNKIAVPLVNRYGNLFKKFPVKGGRH
jgi:hypothetical protein